MIDTSKKIAELIQARLSGLEVRIKALETERQHLAAAYRAIQGSELPTTPPAGRKVTVLSLAARKKIAAAQRKRWAAARHALALVLDNRVG